MAIAKKAPAKKASKQQTVKSAAKSSPIQEIHSKVSAPSAKEEVGAKLRRKGEIVQALEHGAQLVLTPEGLFRIVNADHSENRISKRRASAMISKGELQMVKDNSQGKFYALSPAVKKEASPTEAQ